MANDFRIALYIKHETKNDIFLFICQLLPREHKNSKPENYLSLLGFNASGTLSRSWGSWQ